MAIIVFCLSIVVFVMPGSTQALMREDVGTQVRKETAATRKSIRMRKLLSQVQSAARAVAVERPSVRALQSSARVRNGVTVPIPMVAPTVRRLTRSSSSAASVTVPKEEPEETPYERIFTIQKAVSVAAHPLKDEVVRLVNVERAARGLLPLTRDGLLDGTAQFYSEDMQARKFFGHKDPDGLSSLERIRRGGFLAPPCDCAWEYRTGENLAKGQKTAAQVVKEWMASPSHRENILQPEFDRIGIGIAGDHWVQHFGNIRIWE